ncbi:hypothetical protein ACS0TY_027437 [Phlomoides rotata]
MGWRLIVESNALVCKVLRAKYFPHGDFLTAFLGNSPSYTWRSIWRAHGLVRRGTRWKIGDGSGVNDWREPWLNENDNLCVNSEAIVSYEELCVSDFIIPGSRKWNTVALQGFFFTVDFFQNLENSNNSNRDGNYTVKSGCRLAFNIISAQSDNGSGDWRLIWDLKVSPKVKQCLWRICSGSLPTWFELNRRHMEIAPTFLWCPDFNESEWHTFFGCEYVIESWRRSSLWNEIDALSAYGRNTMRKFGMRIVLTHTWSLS